MKRFFKNNGLQVLSFVFLLTLFTCAKINAPVHFKKFISYNTRENISAFLCLWKNDKRATYTFAFDDARPSHFLLSGPELSKRKMVGTFNLNTGGIRNWNPWRELAIAGHELASHTVHHVKLSDLSDDSIRWELRESKQTIERMVPENGQVLSFANPFGLGSERVTALVKEYYLSERDDWGLNDSSMTPEQLYDVKGVGIYPPFEENVLREKVEMALKKRAWILVYFHTVTEHPDTSDMCQCPLDFFLNHLNFVESKKDSLWIATQRDVAKYIWARTGAAIEITKLDTFRIGIRVKNVANHAHSDFIVSVKMKLPVEWVGNNLSIWDETGEIAIRKNLPREAILNLKENKLYILKAFKK